MTNLERWRYYLTDIESPDSFIDWTFYFMIGAALERRVWLGMPGFEVYPNTYLFFIGPPAVGKTTAAQLATQIFSSLDTIDEKKKPVQTIKRGPNSITLRGLTQFMAENVNAIVMEGDKKAYAYSALALMGTAEISNLLRSDSKELVRFLTEAWECKASYSHVTAGCGEDHLKNICVSMIGCGTEEFLRDASSTEVLSEGLLSRALFIYGDRKRHLKMFYNACEAQKHALMAVTKHVKDLSELAGEVELSPEAMDFMVDWYENVFQPDQMKRKMFDYYGRKKMHLMKLAMIVHFADSTDLTITLTDCEKALDLLDAMEPGMEQALGAVSKNPVAKACSTIKQALRKQLDADGNYIWCQKAKLVLMVWESIEKETEIEAALTYLVSNSEVKFDMMGKRYKFVEKLKRHKEKEKPTERKLRALDLQKAMETL